MKRPSKGERHTAHTLSATPRARALACAERARARPPLAPLDRARWNQQWSAEFSRPYYHNPATQESVWETPLTGVVRELENIAQLRADALLQKTGAEAPDVTLLAISVLLPVLLVLVGLFALNIYMKKYHPDVLEMVISSKKKRDRAQHRRGREGKSKFKPPWKMAQAGGAGGRSANS
jgi:hypothetical protein